MTSRIGHGFRIVFAERLTQHDRKLRLFVRLKGGREELLGARLGRGVLRPRLRLLRAQVLNRRRRRRRRHGRGRERGVHERAAATKNPRLLDVRVEEA